MVIIKLSLLSPSSSQGTTTSNSNVLAFSTILFHASVFSCIQVFHFHFLQILDHIILPSHLRFTTLACVNGKLFTVRVPNFVGMMFRLCTVSVSVMTCHWALVLIRRRSVETQASVCITVADSQHGPGQG